MTATLAGMADNFGDIAFSAEDFALIARIMDEEAGVTLGDAKMTLVYSRLAKRVRALGLRSFAAYCDLLQNRVEERALVVQSLVTHHTSFFREAHHFAFLEKQLAPRLLRRLRDGGRVRIWSAGCSTGEEPWSIALTLLKAAAEMDSSLRFDRTDLAILATDISPVAIETARRGVYAAARVETIPDAMRLRWMERQGEDYAMGEAVRALLVFRTLNLFTNWPMRGQFDVIFCRNVMIYFDRERQSQLERRFAERLTPDGHLFIGHSERIGAEAARLTPVGQTIYAVTGRPA